MSSESILSLGGHLKFKSHPDEEWDKYLRTVKNTDLAQKKRKEKKKGIGFQLNEKKITWFLTDI